MSYSKYVFFFQEETKRELDTNHNPRNLNLYDYFVVL
ncbi:hypothetical protein FLA105534_04915 [Flavobacterium bizetiae]|uniref:Uncharacterized protein n=1 Tax=Flavobacterium bizetiae TaxID=2704140 RepID=A0A6J4GWN7_9FLAO|nr:hypothetical protein FLA105534_04915 [Flavobacterium bizetiae]CAD5342641.1 hypothetical protein FLA105535_02630 [Flavobacterium bizetiae]CAD5348176.1 hypothetical protein FLA105534_02136 [Flavobacterium bizetiae]